MDRKITSTLVAGILLSLPSFADDNSAQQGETKKPEVKPLKITSVNSARMNAETLNQWVGSKQAALSIVKRPVGPFGRSQFPGRQITRQVVKKKRTNEFLNAIAAIEINAVITSDKKFIVGSREFKRGDVFPLIRGTREFRTQIVAVKSDNILFKDMDTGEMIKKNLHALPKGMTRNSNIDRVKGITPAGKKNNAPLTLQ